MPKSAYLIEDSLWLEVNGALVLLDADDDVGRLPTQPEPHRERTGEPESALGWTERTSEHQFAVHAQQ